MRVAETERMAALEDGHWWYRALRRRVVEALEESGLRDGERVLDAGCGTGGTWKSLSARWPRLDYLGFDPEPRALEAAAAAGAPRLERRGLDDGPPEGGAAAALCLDSLYYARDERAALAALGAALRPGGRLIVNVPAFPAARGRHDEAVGVRRRYRRQELGSLLESAGLRVERLEYWNTALFPVALAWRALSRLDAGEPRSDLSGPSPFDAPLAGWLALEGALGRRLPMPFGLSLFALARR